MWIVLQQSERCVFQCAGFGCALFLFISLNPIVTEAGDYILSATKVGGSAAFSSKGSALVLEPTLNDVKPASGRKNLDFNMTDNTSVSKRFTFNTAGEANELRFWCWCYITNGASATATFDHAQYKLAMYKASEAVADELPAARDVWADSTYGTLPTVTRTGYTFGGWHVGSEDGALVTASSAVALAEDHTLVAAWTANAYTLTFDPDGGTVEAGNGFLAGTDRQTKAVTYDSAYGASDSGKTWPADPVKTGYTFVGWQNGGKTITANDTVSITEDATLTAVYTRNSYSVTWDVDGKTATDTVLFGDAIPTPDDPQKKGFVFTGWSPAVPTAMPANDLTFTAQFRQLRVRSVAADDVSLLYKQNGTIAPTVTADDGADYTVAYSGFDSRIVSVDDAGRITTLKRGTTIVTVTATDEHGNSVSDTCTVTVSYTWWQWLLRIFLLGFLWY